MPNIAIIEKLAYSIDPRLNLFDGYKPKSIEKYKEELLFWRHVVNMYGLLSDSNPVQVKHKQNMMALLKNHGFISREEYDSVRKFWLDISDLRAWICHNNDDNSYYTRAREVRITKYLSRAFTIASTKPKSLDDSLSSTDWNILVSNIVMRYEEYTSILYKGLEAWKKDKQSTELIDEWMDVLAESLFQCIEIRKSALANIAQYESVNSGQQSVSVLTLCRGYDKQLEQKGFSHEDIRIELQRVNNRVRSNEEIVRCSIRNSGKLTL